MARQPASIQPHEGCRCPFEARQTAEIEPQKAVHQIQRRNNRHRQPRRADRRRRHRIHRRLREGRDHGQRAPSSVESSFLARLDCRPRRRPRRSAAARLPVSSRRVVTLRRRVGLAQSWLSSAGRSPVISRMTPAVARISAPGVSMICRFTGLSGRAAQYSLKSSKHPTQPEDTDHDDHRSHP